MDIRSIIDPDASETARAMPASRQRSDAKVTYPQPQSTFQSPYETQASAYKGPRETRPPQPPPLLPPAHSTHNDLRSPSASSHNSNRSPYQQTPSSAISSGQYPFPQFPAQSLAHGFQSSQYAQRESQVASSTTSYQPYGQQTSISQTPTVTTPISSQSYTNQTRQGSSRSLSTPTSVQSNVVKESPKGSFDPIKAVYESHSSQPYLSQQGTPLRPPSMTSRTTSILRRDSPSASYEHQRNHSAGSYGHQQMMSPSPTTDRPGSSAVSPLASGPRQSLSHVQNYHKKHEREKSLSVSPKTKLPSELNARQTYEDFMVKSKDRGNVSTNMNSAKVEISEGRPGVQSSQEQPAIKSPSRSRSLGMKVILNSPSLNEITSIAKESTVQTKKTLTEVSNNDEIRITSANPIHSDRPESQSWHKFALSSKQNNEKPQSDEKYPQNSSPKWNPAESFSSKPQSQTQAKEYLKEQTSPDSFPPPHLSPLLHTKKFSSVPVPGVNSSPSQSRAIPQSSVNEQVSAVPFPAQPSQHSSPERNSFADSIFSKPQIQSQAKDYSKDYSKESISPESLPPHLSPLLQTRHFPAASVPVANSSPSQSLTIPQSSVIEQASTVPIPAQALPAQTARYPSLPAVPNSTQSPVAAKSPFKEQPSQVSSSPHPSPLQTVGQLALPAAPNPFKSQTPKSPLKEQTPPSIPPYPAAPQSITHSLLPTMSNPPIQQRAPTPPQTTLSPAPSSHTIMSSGSTAVTEPVGQQTATKKLPGAVVPLDSSSSNRRRKRRRFEEIPIYARSCRDPWPPGSRNPGPPGKGRSPVRNRSPVGNRSHVRNATHPSQSTQPTTRQVKQEPNGHAGLTSDVPVPNARSMTPDSGQLGPWESSITNTEPSDEYIKHLSDFLYKEVVGKLDLDVGPAGGGSTAGAVIEIEAKIGQLIDNNTNARLRLPVTTECVLSKDDPGLRVNFKSSMTEVRPAPARLTRCLLIPLIRPSIVP